MTGKSKVLIAISEFVEPRDFGEVVISVDDRVLARKSNIPLYGPDAGVVLEFVRDKMDTLRRFGATDVAFENVDPRLRERILRLLA